MFKKILKCDYVFDSPWWDEVSENAKVSSEASSFNTSLFSSRQLRIFTMHQLQRNSIKYGKCLYSLLMKSVV